MTWWEASWPRSHPGQPRVPPEHADLGRELLQSQAHAGFSAGTQELGSWPGEGKQDSETASSARIRKGKKLVLPARWCWEG